MLNMFQLRFLKKGYLREKNTKIDRQKMKQKTNYAVWALLIVEGRTVTYSC